MTDRHQAVTHNPTVALARAMRCQTHVRVLLRSFSEALPPEWIEGYVIRFEGNELAPTRVVMAAEPERNADGAERIIRIERVALVEELVEDEGDAPRPTMPAPEPRPVTATRRDTLPDPPRGDADSTLKVNAQPAYRRPSRG